MSKRHADGHAWACRLCKNEQNRKTLRKRRLLNPQYAKMTHNMKWLIQYKSTLSCERCGESHSACLEFHHLDPDTKNGEVPKMVRNPKKYSLGEVKNEIAKCLVLCANCHKKEHYEQHQDRLSNLLI